MADWSQRSIYTIHVYELILNGSKVQPISIGPPPNLTTCFVIYLKCNYNALKLSGSYSIHYHGDHSIKDSIKDFYANDVHYDME